MAVFVPIDGAELVEVISGLATFVHSAYIEGPGSISDDLYWWRPEGLVRLPAEVGEGRVEFFPPDEFVELLNRLSEEDAR